MTPVTLADLMEHIRRYDCHPGSSRSAWNAMPLGWRGLSWTLEEVPTTTLPIVFPVSNGDVIRYAASARDGSPLPAIIVQSTPWGSDVVDGIHRLSAARLLGQQSICALVGR